MKGGRVWKSGEMLFYYLGGGEERKAENYEGEINPLVPEAEKLQRLHPPYARMENPLPRLTTRPPYFEKGVWGVFKTNPGGEGKKDQPTLGGVPTRGREGLVSAGLRPLR